MFSELGKIHNPWVRSLAGSLMMGSVITLTGAIVIGVTNQKNDAAYKIAVYSSLLGMGGGALLGVVSAKQSNEIKTAAPLTKNWQDWRNFVVIRKVQESKEITSFYLQPQEGEELPNFIPGQFLPIKLDILGQTKPVIRTYSLSDYDIPFKHYRISVKRELAPQGLNVLPGIASNFLHDEVKEGSVISVKPPNGKFILNVDSSLPAVLISNGVGITPMISMAKAITKHNSKRPIWFFHGARDGSFHAFRDEIKTLAAQNTNLNLHFAYSRPRLEDQGYYDSTGYIDTNLIQSLIGQSDAEYFLCGSPSFMESIRDGLKNLGIPEDRIFYETFTKAKKTSNDNILVEESFNTEGKTIIFNQSNTTAIWSNNAENILEFAEAKGLNPPYSCRQGICGTCKCKIIEGEVEYVEKPTAEVESGSILICISKPKSAKVVLQL